MLIMPARAAVVETADAAGVALHAAHYAEAHAVLAEVLPMDQPTPLDVALVIHRVAGNDVDDAALSVLADLLAA